VTLVATRHRSEAAIPAGPAIGGEARKEKGLETGQGGVNGTLRVA